VPLLFAREGSGASKLRWKMKLGKLINSGIPILCAVLLGTIVSLIFLQIVLRQFFNLSLSWIDEVTQICLTWNVLFGFIWATKNGENLSAQIYIHHKLNKQLICLIDGVLDLVIAIVLAVVAYRSARFSLTAMEFSLVSLSWLKLGYVFIIMPLAMLAMCYYYLKGFFENVFLIFRKN
jgi:TRAP-type C4-dicarboxylate transport system permease small subunit